MQNDNKELGDKKFNNQQKENTEQQLNEGFSGQNIASDYDPSEKELRSESDTDTDGIANHVDRARYPDDGTKTAAGSTGGVDNSIIENKRSVENRDHNYDLDASRYKDSHPENRENRGNIRMDGE